MEIMIATLFVVLVVLWGLWDISVTNKTFRQRKLIIDRVHDKVINLISKSRDAITKDDDYYSCTNFLQEADNTRRILWAGYRMVDWDEHRASVRDRGNVLGLYTQGIQDLFTEEEKKQYFSY